MSTVVANSIRLADSDSNAGWGNYNAGGGSPASEPQRVYQGTGVVGRKANSTTSRTGVDYLHGTGTDVTVPANALVLMKGTVDDNADLDALFGLEFAIGTSEGSHFEYNVAGTGSPSDWHKAYNAVGGVAGAYIFAAIDPTVAGWRDAGGPGGATLTNIRFFALGAGFNTGGAKNENVGLDAIDIGTGLTYSGSGFSFQDGVDEDQGIVANRWGWAAAVGSAIFLRGVHTVTVSDGSVDTSIVFFPDGMHSTGLAGITLSGSADVELAGSYVGLGRDYAGITDTRPDFVASGTVFATLSGTFRNWRLFDLGPNVTVSGSIEAETVSGDALFDGASVVTTSPAGAATFVSPDFGRFSDTTLTQGGAGHAVEATASGVTINIDAFRFNGYGADESTGAAIHNSSGGHIVFERLDPFTPVPTIRNTGGSTSEVPPVQAEFTVQGVPAGAEIRIYDNEVGDGNNLGAPLAGVESHVGGDFVYTHSTPNNSIIVQVIHVGFLEVNRPSSTGVGNQSISIILEPEGNL